MNEGPRLNHGGSGAPSRASASSRTLPGGVDYDTTLRAARTGCTVLITGETGVGKGWLARWIHDHSQRANQSFVPVNCGAIPEALIDSHLFGHARGAFTGATQEHAGMIRAAAKGTLLLDEVSELPPTAQIRLLRLLQEREAQPVGYNQPVTVDVRVIAATNIDLHAAVANGRFREDLLYRMDIVRLHVLPLRERPAEIPGLIEMFNREFSDLHGRGVLTFASDAMAFLCRCQWPGNVRQVRTVLERLHVLCPNDRVTVEDLTTYGGLNEGGRDVAAANVQQVRLQHVRDVVEQTHGSVSKAADRLGVHRSTLYRWLREEPSAERE